jgi:hypothetical protein
MDINLWAVLAATVVMFAVGAFWYSVPFQKAWGKIHGFDKLSKKEQQALMDGMGPIYGAQLVVTVISAYVLTHSITTIPNLAYYKIAFFIWLGFVMPSQVSAVLFSRTDNSMKLRQIAIMSGEALVRLLIAAAVIHWIL